MAVAKRTGAWVYEILQSEPDAADWNQAKWIAVLDRKEKELKEERKANKGVEKAPLTDLEKEKAKLMRAQVRAAQKAQELSEMTPEAIAAKAAEKLEAKKAKEAAMTPEERQEKERKKEEQKQRLAAGRAAKKAAAAAAEAEEDDRLPEVEDDRVSEPDIEDGEKSSVEDSDDEFAKLLLPRAKRVPLSKTLTKRPTGNHPSLLSSRKKPKKKRGENGDK